VKKVWNSCGVVWHFTRHLTSLGNTEYSTVHYHKQDIQKQHPKSFNSSLFIIADAIMCLSQEDWRSEPLGKKLQRLANRNCKHLAWHTCISFKCAAFDLIGNHHDSPGISLSWQRWRTMGSRIAVRRLYCQKFNEHNTNQFYNDLEVENCVG
jgi:hypothetical protein